MKYSFAILVMMTFFAASAQQRREKVFTKADTLRGTITPERSWWDIQRYDLDFTPDYVNKTIVGHNRITYKVTKDNHPKKMQIDLQEPLIIDSVVLGGKQKRPVEKVGSVWYIDMPAQKKSSENDVAIYYSSLDRL